MSKTPNKTLAMWLFTVSFLIIVLVVFGGWVRLSRSGLSIVEWQVITGVIPPTGETAWQEEFVKYQETPEFIKINRSMNLEEYKFIYYNEYIHRMLGRLTGLLFVVPLFYYLIKGTIPWRKSAVYLAIGLLFAWQGFLGWYMVSSGLVDRPSVSHYRLTIHLLTAITLLGFTLWAGLTNLYGDSAPQRRHRTAGSRKLAVVLTAVLLLQIAYGGLVAGLKAGHASSTWPLMYGKLVPPDLLSALQPWWKNLVEAAATVHYIHRWFAFVVLIIAFILYAQARKKELPPEINKGALTEIVLVTTQIILGISVIWFYVPVTLALIHQAVALTLFMGAVYLNHRLWFA